MRKINLSIFFNISDFLWNTHKRTFHYGFISGNGKDIKWYLMGLRSDSARARYFATSFAEVQESLTSSRILRAALLFNVITKYNKYHVVTNSGKPPGCCRHELSSKAIKGISSRKAARLRWNKITRCIRKGGTRRVITNAIIDFHTETTTTTVTRTNRACISFLKNKRGNFKRLMTRQRYNSREVLMLF